MKWFFKPVQTEPQQMEVVPLDELLKQVVDECVTEATSRQCGIALEIEAPATLRGSTELLRGAVRSILRKAIHDSPRFCMIELRLRRSQGQAEVLVRDFGPGAPEAALDQICGQARRAIAVHRGKLRARNSYPGLSVVIELPLAAA